MPLSMNVGIHLVSKNIMSGMLLSLILLAAPAQAAKVAGVTLDDSISIGSSQASFNGAGLRKKLFIKLYVGSLYLANPSSSATTIINADEAMAIRLNILSNLLTRDKLIEALDEGFNNSTGGKKQAIQPQIDQMLGAMQQAISSGDSFTLSYEPAIGTHLIRNGQALTVVAGLDFKKALFGIWLSNKPAQDSLKQAMLGR